jgi:hypothetical protein
MKRNLVGVAVLLVCSCAGRAPTQSAPGAGGKADGVTDSQQLMTDPGSAKLATLLGGHTLICGPADGTDKTEEKGFYPFTVSAVPKDGQTLLSVVTADPNVGFGFGGSAYDPVEITDRWAIISQGDDGRRHLFVELPSDSAPDPKCGANGVVDGDLAGVVSEIWDAGHITSRGVQCCLK